MTPRTIWIPLIRPPKWVKNASDRWYDKQKERPYDKVKYFYGKTYIYKVFYECKGQGQIKDHFYKRRRYGR